MIPVETSRYVLLGILVILKTEKALLSVMTLLMLQNNTFERYWRISRYFNVFTKIKITSNQSVCRIFRFYRLFFLLSTHSSHDARSNRVFICACTKITFAVGTVNGIRQKTFASRALNVRRRRTSAVFGTRVNGTRNACTYAASRVPTMHVSRANLAITRAVIDGNGGGKSDLVISTSPLATHDWRASREKRNFDRFQRRRPITCGARSHLRWKISTFWVLRDRTRLSARLIRPVAHTPTHAQRALNGWSTDPCKVTCNPAPCNPGTVRRTGFYGDSANCFQII